MKIHIFYLSIFFIFLSSCSQKMTPGKYKTFNNQEVISIDKDSSFSYNFYQHHLILLSIGKVKHLSQGKYFFDCMFKDTGLYLKYAEVHTEEQFSSLNIKLKTTGGSNQKDYRFIFFDQAYKEFKDLRGDSLNNIRLPINIQSFFFAIVKEPLNSNSSRKYLSFNSGTYLLNSGSKKISIDVNVNDTLFSNKVFFMKDYLKFTRHGLKLYNSKLRKSVSYKKVDVEK